MFKSLIILTLMAAGSHVFADAPAVPPDVPLYQTKTHPKDLYLDKIQPILNARCVACHGCYEAPCQLNLQSYEGVSRGFNPSPLYSLKRAETKYPTRMGIDAKTTAQWRNKEFFPVVSSDPKMAAKSVLYQLLELGQSNEENFSTADAKIIHDGYLKDQKHACIASEQDIGKMPEGNRWKSVSISNYLATHKLGGMPLGLVRLDPEDEKELVEWMAAGAPGPSVETQRALEQPAVAKPVLDWEKYINQQSTKVQHVARFVYEHVFSALIHFDENPSEYFELVRSYTATGPIEEIVTELPYQAPPLKNKRAFYRFRKVTRALAQKTQNVWRLNIQKLWHLHELFIVPDWNVRSIPAPIYDDKRPNSFRAFAIIPARMRAQFVFENSKVIIGAMVQGTVCIGSQATYAIADHFWAWFLKPEIDPSVTHPDLGLDSLDELWTGPQEWQPKTTLGKLSQPVIERILRRLDNGKAFAQGEAKKLAAEFRAIKGLLHFNRDRDEGDEGLGQVLEQLHSYGLKGRAILGAADHFLRTIHANQKYLEAFEVQLRKNLRGEGLSFDHLWMGDGDKRSYPKNDNPNAWISVTRHERSATVQNGPEGGFPQSVWVMSYANFERLYYNLVASFKVWGSVPHKLATWRHMSYVRLEGEDLAISMLPPDQREDIREQFTRGLGDIKNKLFFPFRSNETLSGLKPRPTAHPELKVDNDPHGTARKFMVKILERSAHLAKAARIKPSLMTEDRLEWEESLEKLQYKTEVRDGMRFPQFLPNISYVRIEEPKGQDWIYTLQVDRGYKAHNIVVLENPNKDPQYDSMAVYRGMVGAYPGMFFHVKRAEMDRFITKLGEISSEKLWQEFVAAYGVKRNSGTLWEMYDWFTKQKQVASPGNDPVDQGLIDLSQYSF